MQRLFVVIFSFTAAVTHANSECVQCHTEPPQTVANGCAQCHAAPPTQLAAVAPPQRPPTSPSGSLPLGMSVPMLYPDTRIGKEPNAMVLIPAGEFIRGTNERLPDEGPQHKVTLKAFHIDKYEVTNLQYEQFIKATHRRSPIHFRNRTYPEGKADHPVINVTWEDARDYCAWAGKRLPTDEEWEKAARGSDGRTYPWGNEFDETKANVPARWRKLGVFGDTTPVGAFEGGKSPYGVYDLSGNVWEWTDSWYQAYPGNTLASENYGERYKTLKGGSWFDCSFYQCGISAPVFNRAFFAIKTKNDSFGFRCAKDVK
jgi:formylglycine-generating enzyme required for sulfatase activity